ncbi:MAG: AI-2E family transporter [Nanoarchaeota archaeon]|nr:AI-2E family transporter [Nanoarchaeota archaeon]
MQKEMKSDLRKYIFWAAILFLVISSYFIIKPYLIALISAFILSFLIKPIYSILNSKGINKRISAILCIFLLILLIIIPIGAVVGGITQQAYSVLNNEKISIVLQKVSEYPIFHTLNINIDSIKSKGLAFLITTLTNSVTYIPAFIISLFILILGIYYILINWEKLSSNLSEFLPVKDKQKAINNIRDVTKGLVYGTIFIALIEAIVAMIGFGLLGVNISLLLAALIFFFAFIPGVGPAMAWGPVALYYLITQQYGLALGALIIGIIISLGIDNLLRIKILGDNSKIHPLIMLVGILGGITLFGIFGFIIGPLILIYTLKLLEEAMNDD